MAMKHRGGNLTGMRFGRLVALKHVMIAGKGSWKCMCDCGKVTYVRGHLLKDGQTSSCGCYWYECISTHRLSKTRTYRIWIAMRKRCDDPKYSFYDRYGGRGVTYCDRWKVFENFYADMGEAPDGTSLDRIDVDGIYEPSNCRWATRAEQARNKSTTKRVMYEGNEYCFTDLARKVGLSYCGLKSRLSTGMTLEQALSYHKKGPGGGSSEAQGA